MSDPHPETLPATPLKPKEEVPPGPMRMEVDHLLARVDDVLEAFATLAPFTAREIYEVRIRSEQVNELLRGRRE